MPCQYLQALLIDLTDSARAEYPSLELSFFYSHPSLLALLAKFIKYGKTSKLRLQEGSNPYFLNRGDLSNLQDLCMEAGKRGLSICCGNFCGTNLGTKMCVCCVKWPGRKGVDDKGVLTTRGLLTSLLGMLMTMRLLKTPVVMLTTRRLLKIPVMLATRGLLMTSGMFMTRRVLKTSGMLTERGLLTTLGMLITKRLSTTSRRITRCIVLERRVLTGPSKGQKTDRTKRFHRHCQNV